MRKLVLHSLLLVLALTAMLPLIWLLCAAFKSSEDLFSSALLPWGHLDRLTLDNFRQLLGNEPFSRWLINSLFLASATTVLVVTTSSLAGFALAKYDFAGKWIIAIVMLGTVLLPYQVILPGMYEMMYKLGWVDSYFAIIIPGAVSVFGIFLFRQAMLSVPDELIQCGRLDGCSELRIWWEIALPIVRPMVGA